MDDLARRLRQLHAAFGSVITPVTRKAKPQTILPGVEGYSINFTDTDPAIAANFLEILVRNLASLKDRSRKWAREKGQDLPVDQFVQSHRDVALVHDLNNHLYHGGDDRNPKSGCNPTLTKIRSGAQFYSPHGPFAIGIDPVTMQLVFPPPGTIREVIDAHVVDEHGRYLGGLLDIVDRAILAWETFLRKAGVAVPEAPAR